MHIPQYIYAGLSIIGLMAESYKHGKLKTGKHDVWTSIIATVIISALLFWGGFFSH